MHPLRPRISTREWLQRALIIALFVLLTVELHADEPQHDLLLFTSIDTFTPFDAPDQGVEDSFARPALDVLYSYSTDRFRFLGEYLWSSTESELERLKVGWQAGDNTMLWFGRFHSTAKFWTSEYHHGQFMQTPITRPSVEEWEDESGPIPSHITGLSLEHESLRENNAAIDYAFSVGLAAKFAEDELMPYDLFDPESDHGLSVNYRMVYRPDIFSDDQFGLLLGWNDINVESDSSPALTGLNDIQQLTIGIYVDWRWNDWRLLGNIVRLDNELNYVDNSVNDKFSAGYLQLEYQAKEDWTVFARADISSGEDNSPYLSLLPAFVSHRQMLGVRWDFREAHSLTLEVAATSAQGETLSHNNFKEVRLQWSAVFP